MPVEPVSMIQFGPDHTVRVGRWRENLTDHEVRAVIPIVASAARIQGYDLGR